MTERLITLFKFGIVGIANTAVDAVVFALLAVVGVPVLIAQVISYSCGVTNSYWLNGRWTFRDARGGNDRAKLIRFLITNLVVLALTTLILMTLHDMLGWSLVMSKILATLMGMVLNYMVSRYWVFRIAT
ncbi:GtrA family protein [Paenibacillus sp. 1781tsa1]|uniref:GtrA family protein n=1 Tax=Paenibacillus sp. 1781tsa1 TaxID=2953810 RepID=UPI0020A171C3|nr:GtrA family protein [Paenibacillus sp. 1781tsa1]MCP1184044.1 GtrA family protein [Paenibacillus sp. 1781tsa1]